MTARDRSRSPSAVAHPAISAPSPALGAQPTYDPQQTADFFINPTYTDLYSQPKSGDTTNQTYLSPDSAAFDYSDHLSPASAYQHHGLGADSNSTAFPGFDVDQIGLDGDGALDPSVLADLGPANFDLAYPTSADSASSLDPMATMQHSATPPHLLPAMAHHQSNGHSASSSPSAQQAQFHAAQRARAPSDTLDPSSAMFPHGQNDWSHLGAYRGHQRTASDNYSDISSHSNQGSPYMPNVDSFDANARSSPLLDPTHDPAFNDALGLNHFSLNEIQPQQQYGHSPGHSPHISPRLSPQQPLPIFSAEDNFGFNPTLDQATLQQPTNGLNMYPNIGNEPFPTLQSYDSGEMGHADAMSPPEINIFPAPPSKNSMDNQQPNLDDEALSPPLRTNRMRAKSAPHGGSRPPSPAVGSRGRSPSLQPTGAGNDSLTPFDLRGDQSRSPSPARDRSSSLSRGRSSSNPSEQREHVLAMVNNERTPSSGGEKRQQKHPATFQCPLCPKRFTRAYNLRSHLRTHTDERPFVCTVCGKAFARQHDRRRHEGLHSGEKKFVCRGTLQNGAQWGCGRRFARADALGRHFRSEAGRVCIAPLLEEEAAERQKAALAEQAQDSTMAGMGAGLLPQQQNVMASFLPAAILAQYPVLANIDWSALPAASGNGGSAAFDDEPYGGRSSFEASSGGDIYDELSDGDLEGYTDQEMSDVSGLSGLQQPGLSQSMNMAGAPGMSNATSASQGYNLYGTSASDYLSGFEGR